IAQSSLTTPSALGVPTRTSRTHFLQTLSRPLAWSKQESRASTQSRPTTRCQEGQPPTHLL
ncbi:hypothetical protein BGZ59_009746, partial [Podila verticillata]